MTVDILAQRLIELAKEPHLAVTQQQLASELGTAREAVSRLLNEFQRRGWLTLMRGGMDITPSPGLRPRVEHPSIDFDQTAPRFRDLVTDGRQRILISSLAIFRCELESSIMTDFTPLQSLLGGILIGSAAVLLMALHGRIAG